MTRLAETADLTDVQTEILSTVRSFVAKEIIPRAKEYEIERLMREAPFLLIGEGTSEIQKTIISRGLLEEYASKR